MSWNLRDLLAQKAQRVNDFEDTVINAAIVIAPPLESDICKR
jgi:hypothetical protein